MTELKDKCIGCFVAGAAGDALGYEVEFLHLTQIQKRFGEGIKDYVLHGGVAQFSDDTQMTLFTAEGILNGIKAVGADRPESLLPYIKDAYLAWYSTQTEAMHTIAGSSLCDHSSLWDRRAPGNTCMSAMYNISIGKSADNNSKGCGGVIRVAPIGVAGAIHHWSVSDTMRLAGSAAALTHLHPDSTYASALCAGIIKCLIESDIDTSKIGFHQIIKHALTELQSVYGADAKHMERFAAYIDRAIKTADSDLDDAQAIKTIGEGWVGDEALAIAIFSVYRHIDSIEDCLVCAVNHDGDSDSTGAIAGNILGAILGYSRIPAKYIDNLELRSLLVETAEKLAET